MAVSTWQVVAVMDCGRAERAELLEQRVYPTGLLDDASDVFQVRARRCRQEQACRDACQPCRWTGLNPNYDPFAGSAAVA